MSLPLRFRTLAVAPGVAALVLLFVVPLVHLLIDSVHVHTATGQGGLTFANFTTAFTSSYFRNGLLSSLWISGVVTGISVAIGFPFAQLYARASGWGRFGFALALFLPLLTSSVVTSYGWVVLLAPTGLVNQLLQDIGVTHTPLALLYHPVGDIIAIEEWVLPFAVLPMAAALSGIPPELPRAASSLGASSLQILRRVTIPLASGGIVGGASVAYALSMSSYTTPAVVGGGRLQVLPVIIYTEFMSVFNDQLGAALAVVLLAVVLLPVALFVRGNVFAGAR